MKKSVLVIVCALAALSFAVVHVSSAAAAGPAIAVCATDGEEATAQAALQGSGLFSTVDTLNCQSSAPSVATLENYAAVYAFPDGAYADFATTSANLASYVDNGGHLVVGQWAYASCCGTFWGTTLDTGGYLPVVNLGAPQSGSPGGSGGTKISVGSMQFTDSSSPLLAGVSSVGSSDEVGLVGLAPGATQVATWDDGSSTPAVAYKGNVVALNIWIDGSGDGVSGDWLQLLENALLFNGQSGKYIDEHVGFCTVAGNYNPATGVAYTPGTFLVLDEGWNTTVAAYAGAVPANYVQGEGITCDPPPPGYVLNGYAPESDQVPGNTYPYYAQPSS